MIQIVEGRIQVSGPITMLGAASLLTEGEAAIRELATNADKVVTVDLSTAGDLDSSCLALVFAWVRAAKASGASLRLLNPPENLLSLAAVYDVVDLLPA